MARYRSTSYEEGDVVGFVKILRHVGTKEYGRLKHQMKVWDVECLKCGRVRRWSTSRFPDVRLGGKKHCSWDCRQEAKKLAVVGQKRGVLTVVERVDAQHLRVRCDCGIEPPAVISRHKWNSEKGMSIGFCSSQCRFWRFRTIGGRRKIPLLPVDHGGLTELEEEILWLRDEGCTLEQIGESYGLTREWIRQLERRGMEQRLFDETVREAS